MEANPCMQDQEMEARLIHVYKINSFIYKINSVNGFKVGLPLRVRSARKSYMFAAPPLKVAYHPTVFTLLESLRTLGAYGALFLRFQAHIT
jgi:hypothetical protein